MIFNERKALLIGTYGLIHAIVDLCCAAMLFSFLGKVEIMFLLQLAIIYNSLAFGLQFVFGFAADKFKRYDGFAIFGCLLLILGIFLYKSPLAAELLLLRRVTVGRNCRDCLLPPEQSDCFWERC